MFVLFHVDWYMPNCMYVHHTHAGALGGHKRVSGPLELGLLAVVSHPIWVLGVNMGLLGEQQALLTTQPSL